MAGLNQLMGCLVFEITIFDCICLHVHVEPFFITVTLDTRLLLDQDLNIQGRMSWSSLCSMI
jgi:hypothetical protein